MTGTGDSLVVCGIGPLRGGGKFSGAGCGVVVGSAAGNAAQIWLVAARRSKTLEESCILSLIVDVVAV